MMSNNAKVAIVTGADRGIGRGIANRLAEEGYDVCITYYSYADRAQAVKEEIEENYGRRCEFLQADFRDAEVTQTIVKKTVALFERLDLLVNNAAIMPPRRYQFDYEVKEMDDVIACNYRGYMILMRDAMRYFIKNDVKGNIVNVSSESGLESHQKFSLYGGIKAAICHSTKCAALDGAPYGIRINCVVPGTIASKTVEEYKTLGWNEDGGLSDEEIAIIDEWKKSIPLRRAGENREVGNAIVWLASDEAAYTTGHSLIVDGGLTLTGMTEVFAEENEVVYGRLTHKKLTEEDMKSW